MKQGSEKPVVKVIERTKTFDNQGNPSGSKQLEREFVYKNESTTTDLVAYTLLMICAGVVLALGAIRIAISML